MKNEKSIKKENEKKNYFFLLFTKRKRKKILYWENDIRLQYFAIKKEKSTQFIFPDKKFSCLQKKKRNWQRKFF